MFSSYAEADKAAKFPHLVIVPGKLVFEPDASGPGLLDADDAPGLPSDKALVYVGRFVGSSEFHVATSSKAERDKVEEQIEAAFFQEEGREGVLVFVAENAVVGGIETKYDAPGACTLENEEWRDERVLAKARYQFVAVGLVLPVYVIRESRYTIEEIVHAMQNDASIADPEETSIVEES